MTTTKSIYIINEFIEYWNSFLKLKTTKEIIIKDEKLRIRARININGNLEDFKRFWNLLITPGYVGFSTKDFLEFLSQRREWSFTVTENGDTLVNLPSDKIFFLLELGDNAIKERPFTLKELNELEDKIRKNRKEVMYYVVGNSTNKDTFKFYILY